MRIAYLDCWSGISGDMTLAALIDAGVDAAAIQAALDTFQIPGLRLKTEEVKRHGFRATQVTIEHQPEHAHRHLHHITELIDASGLTPRQQDLAKRIFTRLGEAEAKVHGTTLRKVHFHEVGAVDSIADICGAAVAWDLLNVDRIVCSTVPTGRGAIEIAHGRCTIPAPATAELLVGVPLEDLDIPAELTTPTGAAIVATLADAFGPLPRMTVQRIGYGAGGRDLPQQANVLRLLVGESPDPLASDVVWVMETNLDDTSGELVGYCTTKLLEAGALDVYTTAIQMKKGRPGVTLTVLCAAPLLDKLERILFRETHTLGVRRWPASRHKLERSEHVVQTPWGPVVGKLAWIAGQPPCFSPEYEACSKLAQQHGLPLKEVYEVAQRAYEASPAAARPQPG